MCGSGATILSVGWGLLSLPVVVGLFLWWARPRLERWRLLAAVGFVAYIDVLLSLTFLPLPLPPYDFVEGCPFVYLAPFETIGLALSRGLSSHAMGYLIGNVAAFVPLGILLPLLVQPRRPWLTVLLAGAALSAAIEVGQLVASLSVGFPYRQADVDDVLMNTLGAIIGYGLIAAGPLKGPVRRLGR